MSQKYGLWTVIEEAKGLKWLCRCDCGTERYVIKKDLRAGKSRSCGCLRAETILAAAAANRKHGMADTSEYRIWVDMRRRCANPKRPDYKNYGGRGISVCQRWAESFDAFLTDMGRRPRGATLDRRDNFGNYEPGNVFWVDRKTQERNKRTNTVITVKGQKMTAVEASERFGINQYTLYNRLRLGWDAERAVSEPIRSR